ncbi:hypothetical protein FB451DRAFT_1574207 [Mycena latifolia]|nr:hypothetical protein FB451DRAFT_1574207 [Mycena latifolia]
MIQRSITSCFDRHDGQRPSSSSRRTVSPQHWCASAYCCRLLGKCCALTPADERVLQPCSHARYGRMRVRCRALLGRSCVISFFPSHPLLRSFSLAHFSPPSKPPSGPSFLIHSPPLPFDPALPSLPIRCLPSLPASLVRLICAPSRAHPGARRMQGTALADQVALLADGWWSYPRTCGARAWPTPASRTQLASSRTRRTRVVPVHPRRSCALTPGDGTTLRRPPSQVLFSALPIRAGSPHPRPLPLPLSASPPTLPFPFPSRLAPVAPHPLLHDHARHRRLPRLAPALYLHHLFLFPCLLEFDPSRERHGERVPRPLRVLVRALISASSNSTTNPIGAPGVPNIPPPLEVVDNSTSDGEVADPDTPTRLGARAQLFHALLALATNIMLPAFIPSTGCGEEARRRGGAIDPGMLTRLFSALVILHDKLTGSHFLSVRHPPHACAVPPTASPSPTSYDARVIRQIRSLPFPSNSFFFATS